jgi:uncharacterized protein (DUF433 family)
MTSLLTLAQQAEIAEIKARHSVEAHVWVAPGRYHGQPCISGHRIPTRMVAEGIFAGLGEAEYTNGYDLTRHEGLVACWFEARYTGTRKMRRAWRKWLDKYESELWHSDAEHWDAVPMPPAESEL